MITKLMLGMALVGSEWVLYVLIFLSMMSIAVIIERFQFYRTATKNLDEFRNSIRNAASQKDWTKVQSIISARKGGGADFESGLSQALVSQSQSDSTSPEILAEAAQDAMIRNKVKWEKNLSLLATIGNNAPFVGLFGTVLGIIQAFHNLSQAQTAGMQAVTTGISEALIATAIGILVAIPAVVAFNLYQRKVRSAVSEAEALKSFLISKISRNT